MRICIYGGGNLGHVVAGFIAAKSNLEVVLLTRHPEKWSKQLLIDCPDGQLRGTLYGIYGRAEQAVSQADVVLLCLPGFSIREGLQQIKPFLPHQTAVGSVVSSTGFFFAAQEILSPTTPLFGFQRVPFISRIVEYGHRARLMGYKNSLKMAVEHSDNPKKLCLLFEQLLATPVALLHSHYEASLTNSNPLLHPARLYTLWKDWHEGISYDRNPLFYEEWTDEASQSLIDMDQEFFQLLNTLPISPGSIPTILDYYESHDAPSLTHKLRSIEAFKGISSPMKGINGRYIPDFQSRYFTEDFPYGLAIIQKLLYEKRIPAPTINRVCQWGLEKIKSYNQ